MSITREDCHSSGMMKLRTLHRQIFRNQTLRSHFPWSVSHCSAFLLSCNLFHVIQHSISQLLVKMKKKLRVKLQAINIRRSMRCMLPQCKIVYCPYDEIRETVINKVPKVTTSLARQECLSIKKIIAVDKLISGLFS
jgi:hypothetical protein